MEVFGELNQICSRQLSGLHQADCGSSERAEIHLLLAPSWGGTAPSTAEAVPLLRGGSRGVQQVAGRYQPLKKCRVGAFALIFHSSA